MDAWITNPNVVAVLWAGLGGQEAGNSIADVLYGLYNPSGRLPYTIAKSASDYNTAVLYSSSASTPQITYSEGMFFDYRYFDNAGITPRFEFGFGLSYTTFSYSNLEISGGSNPGTLPIGLGSSADPTLHDDSFVTVTFTLQNNGSLTGTEIPQLYLTRPASSDSPPYILRGFDAIWLTAGQSTTVSMGLSRYDFAIWNVVTQSWQIPSGTTTITIGTSSRDHRLTGTISF